MLAGQSTEVTPSRTSVAPVQILRIPAETSRLELCRAVRIPRLLYLEGSVAAPRCTDPLEDWVRPPIQNADLSVRIARLRALAVIHMTPSIDEDGVVRFGANSIPVTPLEAVLMSRFIESYRSIVRREMLERIVWLDKSPDRPAVRRNALDAHVLRLRRRLAKISLGLRTVWGTGYALEPMFGALEIGASAPSSAAWHDFPA
jgi:DNA-binding winged helix-turn-helix (wHTH) protein